MNNRRLVLAIMCMMVVTNASGQIELRQRERAPVDAFQVSTSKFLGRVYSEAEKKGGLGSHLTGESGRDHMARVTMSLKDRGWEKLDAFVIENPTPPKRWGDPLAGVAAFVAYRGTTLDGHPVYPGEVFVACTDDGQAPNLALGRYTSGIVVGQSVRLCSALADSSFLGGVFEPDNIVLFRKAPKEGKLLSFRGKLKYRKGDVIRVETRDLIFSLLAADATITNQRTRDSLVCDRPDSLSVLASWDDAVLVPNWRSLLAEEKK